ncbi:MAG TPA: ribonuclease domain-containing protein [Elusimicrobiales bacterium]|nr:ribonuclease domain-containing protein [Elusimicrobiales bacterium]
MKKTKLSLLLSALVLANFSFSFAAPTAVADNGASAYSLLLAQAPALDQQLTPPTPYLTAVLPDLPVRAPACKPSQALLPGKDFVPRVSDERRIKSITELLAKIAVCKPLPYTNDGIIHTTPRPGLPHQPDGYYKEYTLIVPGRHTGDGPEPVVIGGKTYMTGPVLSTRGPERLMIGDNREVFYTPDHYTTFILLNIVR